MFSRREGAGTVSLACSMQYSRVGGLGLTEGHAGGFWGELMDFSRAEKLKSMIPFSQLLLWYSPPCLVRGRIQ